MRERDQDYKKSVALVPTGAFLERAYQIVADFGNRQISKCFVVPIDPDRLDLCGSIGIIFLISVLGRARHFRLDVAITRSQHIIAN
jgi:hypothetical protein